MEGGRSKKIITKRTMKRRYGGEKEENIKQREQQEKRT
jgi:hypothetical protein